MKKLSFRVWDTLEGRMILPNERYQGHYVLSLDGNFHNLQNGSGGNECVVMQNTALHDVNGREIYEGDIVKHMIDLGPGGEKQLTSPVEIGQWGPNLENWTYLENKLPEIIGNIFENPELLTHK